MVENFAKRMKVKEERMAHTDLRLLAEGDELDLDKRRRRSRQALVKSLPLRTRTDAVGVQVRRYSTTCRPGCSCSCHVQRKGGTPGLLKSVLGQLFVGYSGIPVVGPLCNRDRCQKSTGACLNLEYWFPSRLFWSQILRVHCAYQAQLGPQLQLSTLRRIPDQAPAVIYASSGNIEGLKDLFLRGLASPRDVSETRGYSLLRWALYEKRWSTCEFLMHEGADPDYGPPEHVNGLHASPCNRASTMLLQHEIFPGEEDVVRLIVRGSDFYDEQDFTLLHEAVLGKTSVTVEEAILQHPYDLETKDRAGRTPLAWAAALGNEVLIALLLAYGANPNSVEEHGVTPIYNVAHVRTDAAARCCQLLLEAGAETDPVLPPGARSMPPFMVACGDAGDSQAMRTMIEFGANVDAMAPDGSTSLHFTAKRRRAERAQILLEAGASINIEDRHGQTLLTIAVTFNNHRVLKLLLDRWPKYSECPRLKGPNLLSLAAMYADIKTLCLLTETDHLHLMYDGRYGGEEYFKTLLERPDADEKLVGAFKALLAVVTEDPLTETHHTGIVESGLRQSKSGAQSQHLSGEFHVPGAWNETTSVGEWSDEGDDVFEDALTDGLNLAES